MQNGLSTYTCKGMQNGLSTIAAEECKMENKNKK